MQNPPPLGLCFSQRQNPHSMAKPLKVEGNSSARQKLDGDRGKEDLLMSTIATTSREDVDEDDKLPSSDHYCRNLNIDFLLSLLW